MKKSDGSGSNLVQLVGFDHRISLSDGLPSHGLEIKRASVLLRVPVAPTEGDPAPAPEPRQPHLLPARGAPVRRRLRLRLCLLLYRHRGRLSRHRRDGGLSLVRRGKTQLRRGGRRRRSRGSGKISRFLDGKVPVTFRTHILRGRAAEKAAVIDAQAVAFGSLKPVLFSHIKNTKTRRNQGGKVMAAYDDFYAQGGGGGIYMMKRKGLEKE